MQHPFYKRQQGFTLLELLVVITLLAVLAVGALVAYEGVGDQAGATAAANNTATVDKSLRNYRAVTKKYPDQWDNLSQEDSGAALSFLATETTEAFGDWDLGTANASTVAAVVDALDEVGIEELQVLVAAQDITNSTVAPNLRHNEGANPGNTDEKTIANIDHISIMPSNNGAACFAGGAAVAIGAAYAGTPSVAYNERLNKINDSLEVDTCHLVIALGFGHDAAHSTTDASVAIAQAPTHSSAHINPAKNYARYVALFHLGSSASSAVNTITSGDINEKPHLVAVVDPEGNPIDVNLAAANANQ